MAKNIYVEGRKTKGKGQRAKDFSPQTLDKTNEKNNGFQVKIMVM